MLPLSLHPAYRRLIPVICLFSLVSCEKLTGTEIARSTFDKANTPRDLSGWKYNRMKLVKGKAVQFWTEMDFAYQPPLQLEYVLQLRQPTGWATYLLRPERKDITLGEWKRTTNNRVSWHFIGHLGDFIAPATGDYEFRALLVASMKFQPTLQLNKAALMYKE